MLNASIALREHGHRSGRRGPAMKVNMFCLQNRLTLLIVLIVAPLLAASVQNGFSQRKALMKQVELDCLELLGYVESAVITGLRRTLQTAEMVLFEAGRELDVEGKRK